MSQIEKLDSVAIILGFYNDKKYINAQVQSIFEQTHKNIKLFIFDDNSTFKLTKSFLKLTPENKKKLSIIRRKKNIGSAKNFLFALKEIKDDFDYYGFSDQDDIWGKDKIKISINALKKKGLVKIKNFKSNKNKINYIYLLTPKGIAKKSLLTVNFMKRKMKEYEELKKELENSNA